MGKYIVDLDLKGIIEVEAESEEEARTIVENGYSMSQVQIIDDEIADINPTEVRAH